MKVIVHKRQIDRRYEQLKNAIITAVKSGQLSRSWLKVIEKIESEHGGRS